jgi:hypothetical protein
MRNGGAACLSQVYGLMAFLLLLLLNRLPPDITGGQGLKKHFSIFFTGKHVYTITIKTEED